MRDLSVVLTSSRLASRNKKTDVQDLLALHTVLEAAQV